MNLCTNEGDIVVSVYSIFHEHFLLSSVSAGTQVLLPFWAIVVAATAALALTQVTN